LGVDGDIRTFEGTAQRNLVEDVGVDGDGPESRQPLAAGRGPRHTRDTMTGGE
jgi:hypothetical protein